MAKHDWSRFTKRINVNAPAELLYKAWATQDGLEGWFLRLSEFTKPDGTLRNSQDSVQATDKYKWLWHGWPDDMVEFGSILDANGVDSVQFTFAKTCKVTVLIKPENGENIVELTQENIPSDEESIVNYYVGCLEGWTFYLANLKSILEGGVDLRNKNMQLTGVVNA